MVRDQYLEFEVDQGESKGRTKTTTHFLQSQPSLNGIV